MTYAVLVTPTAASDVDDAYRWLHERSPRAADHWIEGLREAIRSLEVMPGRFRTVRRSRSLKHVVRQMLHGRYRVFFAVRGKVVYVLHVRHASRRPLTLDDLRGLMD